MPPSKDSDSTNRLPWLVCSVFAAPLVASVLMKSAFTTPTTDFGTGSMFDGIATRYDFLNRALALNMDMGWRRVMVSKVTSQGNVFYNNNHRDGVQMLDLATGTADVAILLADEFERVKSEVGEVNEEGVSISQDVTITGVDPSQNMINVGNEKLTVRNLSDIINLNVGDARNLVELKDNFFDTATMSFGIRNVPEKEIALCEIHRVLKKEKPRKLSKKDGRVGKLAILEFSEPAEDAGVMGFFARLFIRHVVPVVGAVLSGAPREYMHLQNSIKEFPSPEKFKEMMESLQCGDNEIKGSFLVDEIKQLNFGSVQLYLATPVYN